MDRIQREFFRVVYPLRERPILVLGTSRLEVIECSESGLRYALPSENVPSEVGQAVSGVVNFGTREAVEVEGVVTRRDDRSAAVRLTGLMIPFATILAEQKFLRQHYLRQPDP